MNQFVYGTAQQARQVIPCLVSCMNVCFGMRTVFVHWRYFQIHSSFWVPNSTAVVVEAMKQQFCFVVLSRSSHTSQIKLVGLKDGVLNFLNDLDPTLVWKFTPVGSPKGHVFLWISGSKLDPISYAVLDTLTFGTFLCDLLLCVVIVMQCNALLQFSSLFRTRRRKRVTRHDLIDSHVVSLVVSVCKCGTNGRGCRCFAKCTGMAFHRSAQWGSGIFSFFKFYWLFLSGDFTNFFCITDHWNYPHFYFTHFRIPRECILGICVHCMFFVSHLGARVADMEHADICTTEFEWAKGTSTCPGC